MDSCHKRWQICYVGSIDPICALPSNVGEVGSRAAGAYVLCCPRSGEQHGDHDSFLACE
jgi:hypothetical protein